jgi:lipid II:glycine glycyltransferase (peptidoglycan interpeptide bridge formation enzyme)
MRFNTRYNIRRAYRNGIEIKEYSLDRLDDWYNIYCETAIRNQMAMQEKDYFSALLTNQDNDRRGVRVSLLIAEHNGKSLAAMFLALSNKRGTYLFGASSSKERELMPGYALQWEAIKKAKYYGCQEYDMFGCAPNLDQSHPLNGVHIFKKGFGGKIYHRMGCWDYPYINEEYELIKAVEMNG